MPLETLRPDVIAEIKKDRETRNRKAFEDRIEASVNTFNRRLMRLETESRNPAPAPLLNEALCKELGAAIREFVEQQVGRLKNEATALANRVRFLEDQPQLTYRGVYDAGATYRKNSLVTLDGSLFIARCDTGSAPGNPAGSDWTLCVKRGRDGKDWRETAPAKGW